MNKPIKVWWMNVQNDEDSVEMISAEELFDDEDDGNPWHTFFIEMKNCAFETLDFKESDIDKTVYATSDGGDIFRLKDGRWINVCWRYNTCHIWEEDNEETIESLKKHLE